MIFKKFNEDDIVAGRSTRVASGFWPDGYPAWTSSLFETDYYTLTSSASPSPSYGTSYYDVRRTLYYLNVYPNEEYRTNNDPYFSITYGHVGGDKGSGSFTEETGSIKVSPTKTIYTQYKNMLLGTADLDGKFSFKSGSTTVNADDIWVLSFSTYKMKDKIDEGLFEISFRGDTKTLTLRDDSPSESTNKSVYQLVTGSINDANISSISPTYGGWGAIYPNNGLIVLNAARIAETIGMTNVSESGISPANYNPNVNSSSLGASQPNHLALYGCIKNSQRLTRVRKSEYVPARHYFVRVKNREFNYSNNPTYVYDGTDGIHANGTIRWPDFVEDPKTYITTVGLYNSNNELVAVAKLSRPAVKDFSDEVTLKVRLDF